MPQATLFVIKLDTILKWIQSIPWPSYTFCIHWYTFTRFRPSTDIKLRNALSAQVHSRPTVKH